ncbi:helix-turn-helix transcriptional regulator [Nocardia sp. NPDC001965]
MGRIEEMRVFAEAFAVAATGGPAAVSLSGEPGIGKTRLLHAACHTAADHGFHVLRGQATELEQEIPYAVLAQALDAALGALPESLLRTLGAENLAELGWLLPSLRRSGPPTSAPTPIERQRCHRAVRAALALLASRVPVVLALDDLHWADHASLETVGHLLRGALPGCLLIFTHRNGQLPVAHAAALGRASHEGVLTSLDLGPLTLAEAARLLGDRIRAQELPGLYHECGGNPFYLQELTRVRSRAPEAVRPAGDHPAGQRVPVLVQATLEQEIRSISPGAQRLLQACAVAGEPFDLDLAIHIGALPEDEAVAATDELVATQLVQETGVSGRLRFRHPIIRRAVYERSGYGWRRRAHRRAAEASAARGADLSIRAHHLQYSSEIGDEEALAVLTEAARDAVARAPLTAARWFEAALRLLPAEAACERRIALVVALCDSLNDCGRLRESREVLDKALAECGDRAPDHERARMMVALAATEQGLGYPAEGHRLLSAALDLVGPAGIEAACYRLALAKSHLYLGDWENAMTITTALMQRTRPDADRRPYLLATAANARLATTQLDSALQQGRDDLGTAARILDSLSDREITPELLEGVADLMFAAVSFEQWTLAVAHGERGIRICRRTGHGRHMVDLLHLQAVALLLQGRLLPALRVVEEAVETALLLDNPSLVAITEGTRCWALSLLGRREEALATGARAVAIAAGAPQSVYSQHPPLTYGAALISIGDHARGHEQIVTHGGYGDLSTVSPTTLPYWLRHLVEAEIALGELESAERTVRYLESVAAAAPMMHMRVGDARYARARLEAALGRPDRAADLARAAVGEYGKSGTPLDAAAARLVLGGALAELGDPGRAAAEFGTALAVSAEHDAAELARYARTAQESVKGTSARPARANDASVFAGLTRRQIDIVERIVRGMTNRQIAEELFVSEKTVEAHLSRLFAKLNLSSRTALAARAAADSVRQSGPEVRPGRRA